jgi:uncharacterized protein (UPF0333 family)
MEEKPLVTPINPETLAPQKPSPAVTVIHPKSPALLFIAVILAGIITGFFLSGKSGDSASDTNSAGKDLVNTATEVGSTDTTTFRDTARGTLEAGGLNGEGTHKLIRDGGPSKTAYLVSSIIDLDTYVGKKVEVWGETLRAQKVGWLMDVGRLKILE